MSHSEIMIQLKQQAMNLEKKIGAIGEIEQVFPDLAEMPDRWGTCYMTSQSANSRVNKVEFRVSCGCCNDAPVFAQPYLEINGYKVHSSPFEIEIGCQSPYGLGIIETPGWKENLKKHGILSQEVINVVEAYLADNTFEPYDDDDDDDADGED